MKRNVLFAGVATTIVFGITFYVVSSRPKAKPLGQAETKRNNLVLTIYKDDFAMVRELRPLALEKGDNRLFLRDVSNKLDPQSILLRWSGGGASAPQIASQAYDLGVSGADGLLQRYRGKEVEVVNYSQSGYPGERQKGLLMTTNSGSVVLQTEDKFVINPSGTIIAPIQQDVVPIPQVSVQVSSPASQESSLDFNYLTRGLSWSADYTATLAPDSDNMNLQCWATVTNRTGTNYPTAKVSLVAGTPNRAAVSAEDSDMYPAVSLDTTLQKARKATAMAEDMEQRRSSISSPVNMGDLYAYPVKAPTTIVQEQLNRLLMFEGAKVSLIRDYNTHNPTLNAYEGYYNERGEKRGSVAVGMTFFNKEKEGLGFPLPSGAIRIYEPDSAGSLRYIGAWEVTDTPKEQKVYLSLSNAFDVFTEWKMVKNQQIDKHTLRKTLDVVLHNQKAMKVPLRVIQEFSGSWKMVEQSHKSVKTNASEAQWKIDLPANSKTVLHFVVDMRI